LTKKGGNVHKLSKRKLEKFVEWRKLRESSNMGEFTKRMAFLYTKPKKEITFKDLSEIPKMIEEAKEEFPIKPNFIHKCRNTQSITLEFHDLGAVKLTRVIEWFEKWFGK